MVGSKWSINWEDEDGSDYEIFMSNILNDQSAQSYLDEQPILKNFSLSHLQEGDARNDIYDKLCPISLRLEKTPSFLYLVWTSVANAKSQEDAYNMSKRVKAGHFPAASIMIKNWQGRDNAESSSNSRCPIGMKSSKTHSFLNSVRKSVAKGRLCKTKDTEILKAGNFPVASFHYGRTTRRTLSYTPSINGMQVY